MQYSAKPSVLARWPPAQSAGAVEAFSATLTVGKITMTRPARASSQKRLTRLAPVLPVPPICRRRVTGGGSADTYGYGPGRCLAVIWNIAVTNVRVVIADLRSGWPPERGMFR